MANINFLKLEKLAKGLDLYTRDTMLTNEESAETTNIISCGQYSITKREGTSLLATVPGGYPIDGLGSYYTTSGEKHLLAMVNGTLGRVDSGTWVPITSGWTAGLRTDFCQAGALLFISNGTDVLKAYNGTTVSTVVNGVTVKNLIYYKNCLYGIGNSGYGSRVYRSGTDNNLGNFTYNGLADKTGTTTGAATNKLICSTAAFSTSNVAVGSKVMNTTDNTFAKVTAIDSTTQLALDADIFASSEGFNVMWNPFATSVNISNNDGQDNISLFKYKDNLYVAKNKSIYRISVGTDATATIAVELVDAARGADSHYATDSVENDIFFFNEAGIHSLGYEPNYVNEIRTKIISLRVDPRIQSIAKSALADTCAIYFNNKYYFAYQQGGASYNNSILVYDKYRTGFWEYGLAASCLCEFKDSTGETKLYFGSPTDGKVMYFDPEAKSDLGAAFQTRWLSPKYSVSDYTQSKFILKVLLYMGKKAGNIDVSVYVDGELIKVKNVITGANIVGGMGVAMLGTEKVGSGGGAIIAVDTGGSDIIEILVNKMGRNVQISIEDNTNDKSWELNSLDVALVKLNKYYQPKVK